MVIQVTKDQIALNQEVLSLEEFKNKIQSFEDKKMPIELKIDKEVEYQRVVDVLNALKSEKFYNLDLVTEKKSLE